MSKVCTVSLTLTRSHENITQTDRISPNSHPGGPEDALFRCQEKFSGKYEIITQQITVDLDVLELF